MTRSREVKGKRPEESRPAASGRAAAVAPTSLVVAGLLAVIVFGIFQSTRRFDFIALDDDVYVSANPMVQKGLSLEGARWAFTTFTNSNWHPLTWLSLMLDRSLFGSGPGDFHLTNAFLHALNVAVLCAFLAYATNAVWRSAFVAACFGLHPLHVESVAWITERKDVLSAFFGLLALLAYVGWVKRRQRPIYFLALAMFALGLLAKSMLVTLPVLLLLLDFWPLGRWDRKAIAANVSLILEKVPFFALAAGAGVVTLFAQEPAGRIVPFAARAALAAYAYLAYVGKMFWPTRLAVLYPFVATRPWPGVAAAVVFLVGTTIISVRIASRAPYILTGWFWYLVTLLPVVGLVRYESHAMADRFTYVPLIGLFIAVAWGVAEVARSGWSRRVAGASAIASLGVFAYLTSRQLSLWRDTETLLTHSIAVTKDNGHLHNNLGAHLMERGRIDEALPHFEEAVRIEASEPRAHVNLGLALVQTGRPEQALPQFRAALAVDPASGKAYAGIGRVLAQQGLLEQASDALEKAWRLGERDYDVLNNSGVVFYKLGNLPRAKERLTEAVQANPERPEAHNTLGLVVSAQGDSEAAIRMFLRALEIKHDYGAAERNLERERAKLMSPPPPA